MTAVFLSYSRRDKDLVARLHNALAERGHDVWVDWEDIPKAAGWRDEVQSGIAAADGFVYVISPDSVASEECGRELDRAVELHKRIVPVVAREPDGQGVPEPAASLNWVFLRDSDAFDEGLELLIAAVETDLDHVRTHTRLGLEANRWDAGGRDRSLLLRGSELAAAEAWLVAAGGKDPEPTQLQREFVLASRQGATRRQRTVIGGVSVALLVAIVLAVVALIQRSHAIHESNVAFARQLDAEAVSQYPSDPELSVLLATKAAEVVSNAQSEQALRAALLQSHVRQRFTYKEPDAGDVSFSPDGTRLLITHDGGPARIVQPGGSKPAVVIARSALPGESGWDRRGDRVLIGGGHPGVFDARSGRLIRSLEAAGPAVNAAICGDGNRVVTVDVRYVAHVFDVSTGSEISTFALPAGHEVTGLAMSPDGRFVAEGELLPGVIGRLDLWDARSGRVRYSIPAPGPIDSVSFSPDGSRFVFAAIRKNADPGPGTFVYDTHSGRRVVSFPGSSAAAAFSPDGSELVYATGDGLGHVYFFEGHRNTLLQTDVGSVNAIGVGYRYAVLGGDAKKSQVFDMGDPTGRPVETLAGHTEPVRSAAIGLHDTIVATAANDGTVRLWDIPSQPTPIRTSIPKTAGATRGVPFTDGGHRIVVIGPNGGGRVLTVPGLQTAGTIGAPRGQVFDASVVAPDGRGRLVATLSGPPRGAPTTVEVYDGHTGKLLGRPMTPPTGTILNGAIDYTGTRFATVSTSGESDEWALPSGKLIRRHPGDGSPEYVMYSNDGSMLAVARFPRTSASAFAAGAVAKSATVDLYSTASGDLLRTITTPEVEPQISHESNYDRLAVAFSPDGHTLAVVGARQEVDLYDTRSARLTRVLPLDSYARSVAFSPDGRLLAAGLQAEADVWTLPSALPAQIQVDDSSGNENVLQQNTGVYVSFTRDSQILVAEDWTTFAAFELSGDQQLFKLSPALDGAISPDATRYAVSNAARVSLYSCSVCGGLDRLLAVAKRRVTRGFTPEERQALLTRG